MDVRFIVQGIQYKNIPGQHEMLKCTLQCTVR